MFGDVEIEEKKFYHHQTPIFKILIKYQYLTRFLLLKKTKQKKKYSIGYLHNYDKVKPLNIMLPKTSGYVKIYNGQTKWMYFLIKDNDLLEKCNTIWNKVSADIKKEFDSDPVYNNIFLKTKIKFHDKEVTDFYNKKKTKGRL